MDLKQSIAKIKYFLLDMDGTVYLGDELIGEMDRTLDFLRENGKKIIYLTNNSSKTRFEYEKKLKRLNLFREGDEVYTSGMAAAEYLVRERKDETVCLLGTEALKKDIEAAGIKTVDKNADIALLAYDTELTYEKLCKFVYNLKKGAFYIATHPDINCPAPEVFVPDAGAFMAMIEASTGLKPQLIIGKPYPGMGENLIKRFEASPEEFCMVGDRLHTDIKFGNNCEFNTILVLSGEATMDDLDRYDAKPDFILDSLNDIVKFF